MVDEEKSYEKVRTALINLFKDDYQLLHINASERSISHKLAEHLQKEFVEHKVDCEYNRHGEEPKRMNFVDVGEIAQDDREGKTVYPDIIVHRRGNDDDNLLVIEIKKSNSRSGKEQDLSKLTKFTGKQFSYKIGLFLSFDVTKKCVHEVRCFRNGKEEKDTIWTNLKELGYAM